MNADAQEGTAPLRYNPALISVPVSNGQSPAAKTTALALPFFEDFTDYSLYPSPDRWVDRQAYVNNTMATNMVSRGVATFDALNERGRPYDTVSSVALRYADSLTSQAFDLSSYVPGDSIYLSFFYQPQGLGFAPETGDSFMLYFRTSGGGYRKQWGRAGSSVQPFAQVMIAVTDTAFLYDGFRFRFVNKASININDDVWNLDYIRFAAGRTFNDTQIDDPATTTQPTPLLSDYVAVPYRQFLAAPSSLRAPNVNYTVANNRAVALNVPDGYRCLDAGGGVVGNSSGTLSAQAGAIVLRTFPNNANLGGGANDGRRVVFRNRFFFGDAGNGSSTVNDTIEREQVFDNYLAYDDGTAERSYYLNLFPTLPGKVAIDHNLFAADTLRGVSVLFGQQVPTATSKFFSAVVYRKLAGIDGATADEVLYNEDFLQPAFTDTVNLARTYAFRTPVTMPAGRFYIGINQPALSGSDSLYYALDVNRVGGNHLYYNVLNTWQSSTVAGALMIRPLVGAELPLGIISEAVGTAAMETSFSLYPNPGAAEVRVTVISNKNLQYRMHDVQGRVVAAGTVQSGAAIPTGYLQPGVYFFQVGTAEGWSRPQRWIKL